jgi:septum formation protein
VDCAVSFAVLRFPFPVILASASPRRRELLSQVVAEFGVALSDVDEELLTTEDPWETAEGLGMAKARAVAAQHPDALVIGGDTVVAIEEEGGYTQLAKPADEADARRMLARLAGREHLVITGVGLVWPGGEGSFHETTRVRFRELDPDEIAQYVATGEPMDKAGGYAIQGGAAQFVSGIDGSLSNVIGLPLEALRAALEPLQGNTRA